MDFEQPLPALSSEFASNVAQPHSEPFLLDDESWHLGWSPYTAVKSTLTPLLGQDKTISSTVNDYLQGLDEGTERCDAVDSKPPREWSENGDELWLDGVAGKLWQEMIKQPAFRKYREKMPRTWEKEDQKWPDQMELAFVEALVEHPPIGRRKLNNVYTNDSKNLRGRNELIAIYIEKKTGIKRDRKQVSSHIQVLKPMFRDRPWILSYFKSDRMVRSSMPRVRRRANDLRARSMAATSSTGPDIFESQGMQLLSPASNFTEPMLDTRWTPRSAPEPATLEHFQIKDFKIFVANRNMPGIPCHTFTRLVGLSESEDPWSGTRVNTLFEHFPRLQEISSLGFCGTQVLFCKSSMNLLTGTPPANAELRVRLQLVVPQRACGFGSLKLRTTFFEAGIATSCETTEHNLHTDGQQLVCQLPFGSTFWALRTLAWQNKLKRATSNSRIGLREEVQRAVLDVSAFQELYDAGEHHSSPVLAICWLFDLATDQLGITTCQTMHCQDEARDSLAAIDVVTSSPFDAAFAMSQAEFLPTPDAPSDLDLRSAAREHSRMSQARSFPALMNGRSQLMASPSYISDSAHAHSFAASSKTPYMMGTRPMFESYPEISSNWMLNGPNRFDDRSSDRLATARPLDCMTQHATSQDIAMNPMHYLMLDESLAGRFG